MLGAGLGEKSDQWGIEVQLSLNEWEFFLLGLYQATACFLLQSNICFPSKMFYCTRQSNNQLVLNMYVIKNSITIFKMMEELLRVL